MSSSTPAIPAPAGGMSKGLYWGSVITSGLGAAAFIGTLITTIKLVGSSDSWSSIKGQLTGVMVSSLIGGLLFSIGLTLLVFTRPTLSSWISIAMSAIALTISMTAVAVAAISR